MLELSVLREEKEKVIAGLTKKHFPDAENEVSSILELDKKRRTIQVELDDILAQSNTQAKAIGLLMKEGKRDEAEVAKKETSSLKQRSASLKDDMQEVEQALQQALYKLPNIPNEHVPEGRLPEDNAILSEHGTIPTLYEGAQPHWELIKKYDIIDFDLGNKISGAGFPVYKGKGARLQRALVSYFLDQASENGYIEVQPPILVNEASGIATGQLPDKDGQMYHITEDNLYVIPTAEVPITNIYRDVILKEEELPVKHAGFTPCFRREAGSWGAHVRGLNRLHQFDKVEIVQIHKPENSYAALEEMRMYIEQIIRNLELPYRVLNLCGGDISFTSAQTYDMEVFSAAQQMWLEVSSVSNFETYQSTRLKLRYKGEDKKTQLLHTLNGSALALPRILAAILENNQTEEGIKIPAVLQPYCGFDMIN